MANTTLVIIPTYNEVENIPLIVGRVLDANKDVDVLVVDDNSPDGTGAKADELAATHDEVHVLHRTGKDGLLAAYRAGFEWALEREYEVIVQMDADGSHAPEELVRLLDAVANGADLAIGSRYVDGGEVKNWPRSRYLLSKLGNEYISIALGDDVKDMTAGYRAFRRKVLEELDLDALSNKGYIFQVEIAHKVADAGFGVVEVPITFEDRKLGESKLDASFAAASFAEVTKWGAKEKASFVGNLASETWRQIEYAAANSKLADLPNRAAKAPSQVADLANEVASLTKYELSGKNLDKVGRRVAEGAQTAKDLTTETVRQVLHVFNSGSK
nr:polyprenol monophosphomannose synthase [uncultured Corynebacterium sp.]